MHFDDYYYAPEMNDLSKQGFSKRKKKKSLKEDELSSGEANASSSGASSASSATGGVSGAITAVVSVTAVVTVVGTIILMSPQVTATNFIITHDQINFELAVEESDYPYLISLLENNETLQSKEISEDSFISFVNLEAETAYEVEVAAFVDGEFDVLAIYEIKTASTPIFAEGKLWVSSANINYEEELLELTFELDDVGNYFSDFQVSVIDVGDESATININVNEKLTYDISQLERGYLTIRLWAKSSHPTSDGALKTVSIYKIYY